MLRRVHVRQLKVGTVTLDAAESHHVRDVLRLGVDDPLELFDDAGAVAAGRIVAVWTGGVNVGVVAVDAPAHAGVALTVAAAVPKGDRAEWMVEKLSELGVLRFVPLAAARSVVLPAGRNKHERWERIAVESAKQCRRAGVMTIAPLTTVADVLRASANGWYLSTAADALPARRATVPAALTLLIGPEGGWTDAELAACAAAGWTGVKLTETILRVETAAVAAAAVVLCSG